MRRRFAVLLVSAATLSGAFVVASATPAVACSCVQRTDAELVRDADAVFVGSVVRRSGSGERTSFDPVTWILRVRDVYKGRVFRRQAVVSPASSASCGIEFERSTRYVVFADRRRGGERPTYDANSCGGTYAIGATAPGPELGEPHAPRPVRRAARSASQG